MPSSARRVSLAHGDKLLARMPTPEEARRFFIGDDEPVLEIQRRGGSVEIYPTWHTEVIAVGQRKPRP